MSLQTPVIGYCECVASDTGEKVYAFPPILGASRASSALLDTWPQMAVASLVFEHTVSR